jgi:endoglucanase
MKLSFSHLGSGTGLILGLALLAGCSSEGGGRGEAGLAASEQALTLDPATRFFVPKPPKAAKKQIASLTSEGKKAEANLLNEMLDTPQGVWLLRDSAKAVTQQARQVVSEASDKGEVPVFVAYNIPFRDCAQFSAGGATSKEAYLDWIDGVVAGIGTGNAMVLLEPDGLGIIPWYNPFASRDSWLADPDALEWCQPSEADPATAAADRFEMLRYAVQALKANPNTKVYLDATHSGWLGAGDAADRLLQAGVQQADGFFLNASNYQDDAKLRKYGSWVAKCTWFADTASGSWGGGHAEWCASQYHPANPTDITTWGLTDQWYADTVESQTWVPYPGSAGIKHFVIDSSRNGQGPWSYADAPSGADIQDWCNPPDRGVGIRPTANTGDPLIDAYVWAKVPGESDGQCNRWAPLGSPDPVRGMLNPVAGEWFPEMALELATQANPPL